MFETNMFNPGNEGLLTAEAVARLTAESLATWRRRILLKQIPVVKLGANVRIRRSDLDAFIKTRIRPAATR